MPNKWARMRSCFSRHPYGAESADGAFAYSRDVAESVRLGVIAYPRGKEEFWYTVLA
jgi:hypothetical protein